MDLLIGSRPENVAWSEDAEQAGTLVAGTDLGGTSR